jgi:hypothetical protein
MKVSREMLLQSEGFLSLLENSLDKWQDRGDPRTTHRSSPLA